MLVHTAALNLGLLMRKRFGFGTPRGPQGLKAAGEAVADASAHGSSRHLGAIGRILGLPSPHTRTPRASGRPRHRETAIIRHAPTVPPTVGRAESHLFHGLLRDVPSDRSYSIHQ